MGTYVDLNLFQGDDFGYLLQLSNNDGSNLNVAGYTFASWAKTSYYTSNVAITLKVTVNDATNGNLTLSLDGANTSNIIAGNYVYDVTMKDKANSTSHLMNGLLIVLPGVTNITPPANGAVQP